MGGVKAFQCKNCGGQVQLRAPGQTLAAACQHCGSVTDLSDENLRIIQQFNEKMTRKPLIPFGSRGELEGKTWEVIGFLVRKADKYEYYWEEYLLFNPRYGFRWLLNQYGHWSLTQTLVDFPERKSKNGHAHHNGKSYRPFAKGSATVRYVLGEFYWKVKAGEKVRMFDYINTPEMLSYERDANGQTWSYSRYLEAKEIKRAFPQLTKVPRQSGIVPHQPNKYRQQLKDILPVLILAIALLFGGQIFLSNSSSNKVAVSVSETVSEGKTGLVKNSSIISPEFELKGGVSNVQLEFYAYSLINNWIEASGYLSNRGTNKSYPFSLGTEYYSGVSGGESWTEGSKRTTKVLNNIPAGTYVLGLEFFMGADAEKIEFTVKRDVPIWSNFFILLALVLVFPLYLFVRSSNFEKLRAQESDL